MPFVMGNLLIIKKSWTTDIIWAQNLSVIFSYVFKADFVFSNKGSLGNIKLYRYYVENLCEVNNNQIIFSLPLIEKKGIKREIFKTKKPQFF